MEFSTKSLLAFTDNINREQFGMIFALLAMGFGLVSIYTTGIMSLISLGGFGVSMIIFADCIVVAEEVF